MASPSNDYFRIAMNDWNEAEWFDTFTMHGLFLRSIPSSSKDGTGTIGTQELKGSGYFLRPIDRHERLQTCVEKRETGRL